MKKLIARITLLLHGFCKEARIFLREHVEPVVSVLKYVKVLAESPFAGVAVKLTATQADDMALIQLNRWLPIAIISLELPIKVSNVQTLEEQIQVIVDYLKGLSPEMKNATLAKLATVLSQLKAGGTELKESEIDTLVQLAVHRLKHGTKE